MFIDPDSVINKENFKFVETNIVCSICDGIVVNPIQCSECEKCFCQICLEDWQKKAGSNSCPFRCKNPIFKNSRMINNILSNLQFKCKNGCDIKIPYLQLEEHYNEKCPKLDYKKKYFEYKNKYTELLKKYNELEKKLNDKKLGAPPHNPSISNSFKSKFDNHILEDATNDKSDWICNICFRKYNKKTEGRYRCNNCKFNICLKCKILEENGYIFNNIFKSNSHKHILRDMTFADHDWKCDQCSKLYNKKTERRFRCDNCDYDLCNDCKKKQELNNNFNNLSLD